MENREYIPILFGLVMASIVGVYLIFGFILAENGHEYYVDLLTKLIIIGVFCVWFMFSVTKKFSRILRIACSLIIFIVGFAVLLIVQKIYHTDDFMFTVLHGLVVYLVPFVIGNLLMDVGRAIRQALVRLQHN